MDKEQVMNIVRQIEKLTANHSSEQSEFFSDGVQIYGHIFVNLFVHKCNFVNTNWDLLSRWFGTFRIQI